jgi:hypothetical protein
MMVWSSVFQHQFLDGNPANLTAVPGDLDIEPEGLGVRPTPSADQLGFPMWPGHRLKYAFTDAFEQVIGADIRLDLFVPPDSDQELMGDVQLGDGTVRLSTDFPVGHVGHPGWVALYVGTSVMSVGVPAKFAGPISVRARWHTRGQGHIWIDGTLRAYDPSLAAQASLTLDRLSLSHPSPFHNESAPRILARRLCIRLLREDGAARYLDTLFPIVEPLALPEACRHQVEEIHGFALGEIRRFMSAAINRLTTAWDQSQGGGPFSAQAVAADEAATAAGQAFVRFMLNGRAADAQQVQDQIGAFLAVIEATDPAGYQSLINRIAELADGLEPHCRLALEAAAQPYATSLGPLAELFQKIWARVQPPGGQHG